MVSDDLRCIVFLIAKTHFDSDSAVLVCYTLCWRLFVRINVISSAIDVIRQCNIGIFAEHIQWKTKYKAKVTYTLNDPYL